jgi:hypothetical protein
MLFKQRAIIKQLKSISDNILILKEKLDKIEEAIEACELKPSEINMKFIILYDMRKTMTREIDTLKSKMDMISQFIR